ncbi:pilus assembly protein PilP [Bdellovibrionota bacterium FG-1]
MKSQWSLALLLVSGIMAGAQVASTAEVPPADMMNMRDPFKRPTIKAEVIHRTPLEMYPLDQIKMLGVVTGPNKMRAMMGTPDGKTHFVAERAKVGVRQGVIMKITADLIRVREKIINVLGQEENVDTDILLPPEAKVQARSSR